MTVYLTWIADALRAEGCVVVEIDGWKTRGRPGAFDPYGDEWHHTGTTTSATNTHPTLNTCIYGRSDLAGPLCHVMIGYDGVCYVIAAGRANHAGACNGFGPFTTDRDANDQLVGKEIDYDGTQPMSAAQKDAATRCSAAFLKRFGRDEQYVVRHQETSTTGKWDTGGLTGSQIRALVKDYLTGNHDDDGAPVKTIQKSTSKARAIVDTEWRKLRFSDKDEDPTGVWGVAQGPAGWFVLTVQAVIEGDAGSLVLLRPYRDDPGQQPYPIRSYVIPEGGTLHAELTQPGSITEGVWLRVEAKIGAVTPGEATITSDRAQVATW